MTEGKFSFSIDRGGTFTDVYAATPNGTCKRDRPNPIVNLQKGPPG